MTTINWVSPNDVQLASKTEKTPDDVLQAQIAKLKNFLAWHFDIGATTSSKPQNLIVQRDYQGATKPMLKIAVANQVVNYLPIEDASEAGKIAVIQDAIANLNSIKAPLYEAYTTLRAVMAERRGKGGAS
jgi:hypothetical protein|tara:strand:- start:174 stop:563 length:390 start_codon:yes stop_codon:yes gene_type:complete